jgi:hypothetical protein
MKMTKNMEGWEGGEWGGGEGGRGKGEGGRGRGKGGRGKGEGGGGKEGGRYLRWAEDGYGRGEGEVSGRSSLFHHQWWRGTDHNSRKYGFARLKKDRYSIEFCIFYLSFKLSYVLVILLWPFSIKFTFLTLAFLSVHLGSLSLCQLSLRHPHHSICQLFLFLSETIFFLNRISPVFALNVPTFL